MPRDDEFISAGWRKRCEAPTHFRLWSGPSDGIDLELAITKFARDQRLARETIALGFSETISDEAMLQWVENRYVLKLELVTKLSAGDLIATGFRQGSLESIAIPAAWWRDVTVDPARNEATAHGTTFSGVLVFEPSSMNMSESSRRSKPAASFLREWMSALVAEENVRTGSKIKKEDAIRRCMAATGATWRQAQGAHEAIPGTLRNARGRASAGAKSSE